MPKTISQYKIFIASPSDVLDERAAVKETIDELNLTYGSQNNLRLELIGWETHSAPGINDVSVQEIINADISLDYDLFLGIIWKKFGTPTLSADSGTEEEFNNAYKKYCENKKGVQILFYFKTASTLSLNEIDPNQLLKVNAFKQKISMLHTLYWEFTTISELQGYLRIHIPKRIEDLRKSNTMEAATFQVTTKTEEEEEELGIVDYQEIRDDGMSEATKSLSRLTDATLWIAEKLGERTEEINKARSSKRELSSKEIREYSSKVAANLDDYANRIDPEISIFINAFERIGYALQNIFLLAKEHFNDNKDEDLLAIEKLIEGNTNSKESMKGFLESIVALPRMSKELNRARKNVEEKLSLFISKLEYSENIALELKESLIRL